MDVNRTAQAAQEAAETLKATAQGLGQKAKGAVRDTGAAADLYLHEYAWTTVALVALTAGLVGYFLGARQS